MGCHKVSKNIICYLIAIPKFSEKIFSEKMIYHTNHLPNHIDNLGSHLTWAAQLIHNIYKKLFSQGGGGGGGGLTHERPQPDHVILGPMKGLKK